MASEKQAMHRSGGENLLASAGSSDAPCEPERVSPDELPDGALPSAPRRMSEMQLGKWAAEASSPDTRMPREMDSAEMDTLT